MGGNITKNNISSLVTQVGQSWNQLVREMGEWEKFGKIVRDSIKL